MALSPFILEAEEEQEAKADADVVLATTTTLPLIQFVTFDMTKASSSLLLSCYTSTPITDLKPSQSLESRKTSASILCIIKNTIAL